MPIQLLDELQHHPIDRPLPQRIPRRETLRPRRLPSFILSPDAVLKLADCRLYERVVLWHTVKLGHNGKGLFTTAGTEQVTTR